MQRDFDRGSFSAGGGFSPFVRPRIVKGFLLLVAILGVFANNSVNLNDDLTDRHTVAGWNEIMKTATMYSTRDYPSS